MAWQNNLIKHSFPYIEYLPDEWGEYKKKPKGMCKGWSKLTESKINAAHTGLACLTGQISGIVVLDFDDMNVWNDMKEIYPILDEVPRAVSKKGFHLYFKWTDACITLPSIIKNPNGSGNIDIQGNGKQIFFPGCSYKLPNGKKFEYEWDKAEDKDLCEIPDDLFKYFGGYKKIIISDEEIIADCPVTDTDITERKYSKKEIEEIICKLPKEYYECDNGTKCFKILCAMKKYGITKKVAKEFCQKAGSDYNEVWFEDIWKQATFMYPYSIEYIVSKSDWREISVGCVIDTDELKKEKEEKLTPDKIVFSQFINWAEKNKLNRLYNSSRILKIIKANWAETIYNNSQECINNFISESPNIQKYFECMDLIKLRKLLTIFLEEYQPNERFTIVKKNWRYYSFQDGIYDLINDNFISSIDEDNKLDENILCQNHFNCNFKNLNIMPDILKKIVTDQEWTNETICIYMGLLGRLFYPLNHSDKFQIATANIGMTDTGKSTLLTTVQIAIGENEVKTLDSKDGAFSLEGLNEASLIYVGEAKTLPKMLSEDNFKKLISGEQLKINRKGKTAFDIIIKCCTALCGNDMFDYGDDSGAILSRIALFRHKNMVEKDLTMQKKLWDLVPQLLIYYNKMYIQLYKKSKTTLIFSEQMIEWKDDIDESQDEFKAWLNMLNEDLYTQLKYKKDAIIKNKDLQDAWNKHWKFGLSNNTQPPKITMNQQSYLKSIGILTTKIKYCMFCEEVSHKDCCKLYDNNKRKPLKIFVNCELCDGGLKNKKMGNCYDENDED